MKSKIDSDGAFVWLAENPDAISPGFTGATTLMGEADA